MTSIPPIELHAQIRGGVQFACPDCGNLHSQAKAAPSSAICCKREGCEHRFRVGVGLTNLTRAFSPPSCLLAGKFNKFTANRYNLTKNDGSEAIGRLFGSIAWQCPECHFSQKSSISFFESLLSCQKCPNLFHVTLLLWRGVQSKMVTLPLDWSIPQNP